MRCRLCSTPQLSEAFPPFTAVVFIIICLVIPRNFFRCNAIVVLHANYRTVHAVCELLPLSRFAPPSAYVLKTLSVTSLRPWLMHVEVRNQVYDQLCQMFHFIPLGAPVLHCTAVYTWLASRMYECTRQRGLQLRPFFCLLYTLPLPSRCPLFLCGLVSESFLRQVRAFCNRHQHYTRVSRPQ